MSKVVLVGGATGAVGRAVLGLLEASDARVRVLARNAARAASLRWPKDDTWIGDATKPASLKGACEGVDVVFSSLGASVSPAARDKRSYLDVDLVANRNLLDEAKRSRVRRFVYVSVFTRPEYEDTTYVRAHEEFVKELKASGLEYGVLRPTGLFSAFAEMLPMARKGRIPVIGDGTAETNPMAEAELAQLCREAIVGWETKMERDVGGPEVLTRKEIASLAFAAVSRPPKLMAAPKWSIRAAAFVARPFNPRLGELMAFVAAASTTRCVAAPHGRLRLGDYLIERAARDTAM